MVGMRPRPGLKANYVKPLEKGLERSGSFPGKCTGNRPPAAFLVRDWANELAVAMPAALADVDLASVLLRSGERMQAWCRRRFRERDARDHAHEDRETAIDGCAGNHESPQAVDASSHAVTGSRAGAGANVMRHTLYAKMQ